MTRVGHASPPRKLPWMHRPNTLLVTSAAGLVVVMVSAAMNHVTTATASRSVCAGLLSGIVYALLWKWALRARFENMAREALMPFLDRTANHYISLPQSLAAAWIGLSSATMSRMDISLVTMMGSVCMSQVVIYPEQKALWRRIRELAGVGDDGQEAP